MACSKISNEWMKGKGFIDKSNKFSNLEMNYFNCGVYYFDGNYNVVKFPKDMEMYHGSAILANALVEFPLGVEYYKPYNEIDNMPVSFVGTEKDIDGMLSTVIKITPGWYGDAMTAKRYSHGSGDKELNNICGDRCVMSYKTKSDIVLFLIDDDYNISKLLNSDAPTETKNQLIKFFNIESTPLLNNNRITIKKDRRSERSWDLPFADWLCENVISKENYAGYGATNQLSTYHVNFHLEIIFCNALSWLRRDLENTLDWQHNNNIINGKPIITLYLNQLKLFKTTNVKFHAGNLIEHSIWSLLWAEFYLSRPYFVEHFNPLLKKMLSFSAFIHDIGKMDYSNTKKNLTTNSLYYFNSVDHPKYGEDLINGVKIYRIVDPNTLKQTSDILNIDELIREFSPDLIEYKSIIALIILNHWYFGEIFKNYKNYVKKEDKQTLCENYLETIYNSSKSFKTYEIFYDSLRVIMLVSIADISATQPYGIGNIKNDKDVDNIKSTYFPFLTNLPKKYKGVNLTKIFDLDGYGMEIYNGVLNLSESFYNEINNRMVDY